MSATGLDKRGLDKRDRSVAVPCRARVRPASALQQINWKTDPWEQVMDLELPSTEIES